MSEPTGMTGADPLPIQRRTLHEEVVPRVRDMIIEGELAPGTRINEVQLGTRLGVSRTPLREALKTLASEGLIDLVPSRGAVVRKLTGETVRGMLEVLATLEALGARLACAHADDDGIAAVVALHADMMELFRKGDRLPYYKLNQAIHSAIAALSGNDTLVEVHTNIQSRLKRIRFIGNETPQGWRDAVAEHEEMIAALTARDGERLAAVLTRHLDNTWERVRAVV